MTNLQSIPLNRLVHAKANVRKTGRGVGLDGLMASIAIHGLRQNLNVRPTSGNRFEVVAGGRRLEAMRRLAKSGKLEATAPVSCLLLADDENPTEVSLAENAHRTDMHPDDQCAAFAELADSGMGLEDIGARFGVTEVVVRRRLRLARVSPRLRKLFREGEVSLAQMMALALVDDHAAHEGAWAALPDWNREPHSLRRYLTQEGMPATHRLVRYVTVEAYEAAGGVVLRDLFGDEPPVLADGMLVERLALAKLEEAAKLVRAEGWSWVKAHLENNYEPYDRVFPKEGEGFDPYDMERAGAKLTLRFDGTVELERGLLERVVQPTVAKDPKEDAVPTYSEAVLTDLNAHKTAALRLELAQNPKVALAAVVHALGLGLLYRSGSRSCLDLSGRSANLGPRVHSLDECSAHAALAAVTEAWRETLPADPDMFWDWCLAAEADKLTDLLALLAGLTVDAAHGRDAAVLLASVVSLDMHKHWMPKVEGFFGRLSKPLMSNLLNEVGADGMAVRDMRKAVAAALVAGAMAERQWLPPALV